MLIEWRAGLSLKTSIAAELFLIGVGVLDDVEDALGWQHAGTEAVEVSIRSNHSDGEAFGNFVGGGCARTVWHGEEGDV